MSTTPREAALAAFEKEANEKRVALEREWDVRDLLKDVVEGFEPPFIHYYKLYGQVGSIKFGQPRYSSIQKGAGPTPALLKTLLDTFPPLPLVRYRNYSGLTYRTEAGLTEKERAEGETTPVFPVTFRVNLNSYNQGIVVEWTAMLGESSWEFQAEFNLFGMPPLGYPQSEVDRDREGKITRVRSTNWQGGPPGINVTKYASGSPETFPTLVLWWHHGADLDVPALMTPKVRP